MPPSFNVFQKFLILVSVDDSKDRPTTLLYGIRFIFALIGLTSLTSILVVQQNR